MGSTISTVNGRETDPDEGTISNDFESLLPPKRAGMSPESCLLRALRASSAEERLRFAEQGLLRGSDDPEMTALLLRQRYLAEFAFGKFDQARATATAILDLEELGEIARQDAARVAMALGLVNEAADHLRIAARICPPARRAFHLATLGAYLRFNGRQEEAVSAFEKALRAATKDRAFYQAQLALAECSLGKSPSVDLQRLKQELEASERRRGYDLWILGELCSFLGEDELAARYLRQFLERLKDAPLDKSVALGGEARRAEEILAKRSA